MYFLGIDVGTSSVKVSVLNGVIRQVVAVFHYPDQAVETISVHQYLTEQDPEQWWEFTQKAIIKANTSGKYNPREIDGIDIDCQGDGLTAVDEMQQSLRNETILYITKKLNGETSSAELLPEIATKLGLKPQIRISHNDEEQTEHTSLLNVKQPEEVAVTSTDNNKSMKSYFKLDKFKLLNALRFLPAKLG